MCEPVPGLDVRLGLACFDLFPSKSLAYLGIGPKGWEC